MFMLPPKRQRNEGQDPGSLGVELLNTLSSKYADQSRAVSLIEGGADLGLRTEKNEGEMSALHLAAFYGLRDAALCLLAHGVDADAVDGYGNTALTYCAIFGHTDMADDILEKMVFQVDCRNRAGHTALSLAALNGREGTVRSLIAAGADPFIDNAHGQTPRREVMAGKKDWAAGSGGRIVALLEEAERNWPEKKIETQKRHLWKNPETRARAMEDAAVTRRQIRVMRPLRPLPPK